MIFDKLKALLSRHPVGEETMGVISRAKSTRELLHGLDALHTRNEMEFNEITREIENIEEIESSEMDRVRGGVDEIRAAGAEASRSGAARLRCSA